jgi:D-alanine-D-alanine ligase
VIDLPASCLVLHNSVTGESPADARDILDQVASVGGALTSLGIRHEAWPVDLDLVRLRANLRARPPAVVFNLIEGIDDSGQLVTVATSLLDHLGTTYTGSHTEALMLTSQKILTKRWLRAFSLPTADWWQPGEPEPVSPSPGAWIVKPLWEDASIGMDDRSVVASFADVPARLEEKQARVPGPWFAERRIVGYAAKWHDDSFEARNTVRRFVDPVADRTLCERVGLLARRCWDVFGLAGYARVDFRVDAAGDPWILEVNANPCISPEAGFAVAAAEAGLAYPAAIARIIRSASASRPAVVK